MRALVDAAVLGPLKHSPGRSLLLVTAIALGVALGFAIYLINRSAADEVSLAARSLYGLADLSVEGAAGFDEALYPRIARVPGVAVASPVIEIEARVPGQRRTLKLIGVDGFRSRQLQPSFAALIGSIGEEGLSFDAQAVFLSSRAARDLEAAADDELRVQVGTGIETLRIAGVLPPAALEERAGVIDIAAAQWTFGRLGELSRIDIRLAPGIDPQRVRAQIEALLPPGVRVTTPGDASNEALRLSRSYRSNLTALALVALFTGGFFVYSTQSLAVLRRRRELAILHALGVTRKSQLVLLLTGSALLGLFGAVLGTALGVALASFGLRSVGGDLGAGYFRGVTTQLEVHPAEIVAFGLLGVLVALAGALRPALDAARVPTASALKSGDVTSGEVRTHGALALVLLALAVALLAAPPIAGLPLPGYVSIAVLLIAVVAAMPTIVRWVLARAPRLHAPPYEIAVAQLSGTARYATLSVSAIIVSFSLMVSMAIMVTSFRESLAAWTERILPADLYVRVGYIGQSAHLEERDVEAFGALPGVADVQASRYAQTQLSQDRAPVVLIARALEEGFERSLWLVAETRATPEEATPVWINEAAADLFDLAPGSRFALPIDGQVLPVFVRGIWRDYAYPNGAVMIDREQYVRLSGDRALNAVWLWLDAGASIDQVRTAIRERLSSVADFDLNTPGELRALSLAAFDRTFAVTYLLEIVAILIGLFGIAAGISAQVLARRGELGALRHLGFTRTQVGAMLALEGALLGGIGVVVGWLAGGAVSLILIYVVNRQSFHWSMDVFVPWGLLGGLGATLVAAAALIAVVSGRKAMSEDVVRAVKEDW